MKLPALVLLILAIALPAGAQTLAPVSAPQRPIPEVKHVIIVSIDGLRPDRLLIANTPNLRGMINEGAYTFWAKTTAVSITLPSHVSMLTGASPRRHGIEWNSDLPFKEPMYPRVPTIFELAKRAGYTTAVVTGKSKFDPLLKPGTLDHAFVPEKDLAEDAQVCDRAVETITKLKPELLFIHFPAVDRNGHRHGWGSAEQLAAIELADVAIGRILAALDEAGMRQSTFMVVSADHGGAGKGHGPEDPRSRHIPWIATGPGVRKKFDLTQFDQLEVRTEDTAATACWLLGVALSPTVEGKPVREAFMTVP